MPPTGYLSANGIEDCLQYLVATYPSICQLIELPETSVEGRTCRAIKIANGTGTNRRGVLFIGGVHAREIVNPDLLVTLAFNLCRSYTLGTGLDFGGKSYDSITIQLIVNALDIFIFPLVNPDGRVHVCKDESLGGDPMWRKNRRENFGSNCFGVDLNRNYDFLWYFNLNASSNPCHYSQYKGSSTFTEPETRNVRSMLDNFPNIGYMIDVHSYGQWILHPWSDDENQSTDPTKNFMVPNWNYVRGTLSDTIYKEYISAEDESWFVEAGNDMRDAIAMVRGSSYTVKQAALIYSVTGQGVSGTSKDYAYSRHIVNSANRKVYAYTMETGTEFQPTYTNALDVIAEVSAGLIQFCLSSLCLVEETVSNTDLVDFLDDLRAFRDNVMMRTEAGNRYNKLLRKHSIELMRLIIGNEYLRDQVLKVLRRVTEVVRSREDQKPKVFGPGLIEEIDKLSDKFATKSSPTLKQSIAGLNYDMELFRGNTVEQGLELASAKRKGGRA
ncbi:MAG: carboxypeptidase T [Desulforhopalus sp.]|jgi:carboxypeptidase T